MLEGVAFENQSIDERRVRLLIEQAEDLIHDALEAAEHL